MIRQDYFSNGMAEDILNHLVFRPAGKIRTSTLRYRKQPSPCLKSAKNGVGNIVEGSVKVGDRVRIVVQLIDAK
jgi:TolB-like protein